MHTSFRSANKAQVAGNVDNDTSIAGSSVMGRKRLLLQHVGNLGPLSNPKAAVVDHGDVVKVCNIELV